MAKIIYLIMSVAYNIYNILVRNGHYKICVFAICEQMDVLLANRSRTRGVNLRACASDGGRCIVAVCRCVWLQRGASIHTGEAPPPRRGTRSRNAAILRNFFYFF